LPAPKGFAKGHKKAGGRKKGTPNKLTADIKEAIVVACTMLGGSITKIDPENVEGLVGYMVRLALHQPVTMGMLLREALPRTIQRQDLGSREGPAGIAFYCPGLGPDTPWPKNASQASSQAVAGRFSGDGRSTSHGRGSVQRYRRHSGDESSTTWTERSKLRPSSWDVNGLASLTPRASPSISSGGWCSSW
jgi:hypothetical protein